MLNLQKLKEALEKKRWDKVREAISLAEAQAEKRAMANAELEKNNQKPTKDPKSMAASFKVSAVDDINDYKALVKDFEQQYGENNHQDNRLSFESDKEAEKFFKAQADKGRAFLMKKQGDDKYAYSDGNGHFFMGPKKELDNFINKLNNPSFNPKPSPSPKVKNDDEQENHHSTQLTV
jgi:hypothetical protein